MRGAAVLKMGNSSLTVAEEGYNCKVMHCSVQLRGKERVCISINSFLFHGASVKCFQCFLLMASLFTSINVFLTFNASFSVFLFQVDLGHSHFHCSGFQLSMIFVDPVGFLDQRVSGPFPPSKFFGVSVVEVSLSYLLEILSGHLISRIHFKQQ